MRGMRTAGLHAAKRSVAKSLRFLGLAQSLISTKPPYSPEVLALDGATGLTDSSAGFPVTPNAKSVLMY